MSMIGTVQQINSPHVCIDRQWYDGTNVQSYMPSQVGVQVEFNADDTGKLIFIREKKAYNPQGQGNSYSQPQGNKPPYTPKNMNRSTYSGPKKGFTKDTKSIIKQVIFKAAVELTKGFTFGSPDEVLDALNDMYEKLKGKYESELK